MKTIRFSLLDWSINNKTKVHCKLLHKHKHVSGWPQEARNRNEVYTETLHWNCILLQPTRNLLQYFQGFDRFINFIHCWLLKIYEKVPFKHRSAYFVIFSSTSLRFLLIETSNGVVFDLSSVNWLNWARGVEVL